MGAVQEDLEQMAAHGAGMNDLLSELGENNIPRRYDVSLIRQDGSLTITVPADSWQDAGHSLSNPGSVETYWYKSSEWLLVDLSTGVGDDE